MSANVSETPFSKYLREQGINGQVPVDLFTGNLFDEEYNDAPVEEEDPEGDALRAAVLALIAEEETIEDFCVPNGFVPLNITYKNVFYNRKQRERRAAKKANKVHKTAEKVKAKAVKAKAVKPEAVKTRVKRSPRVSNDVMRAMALSPMDVNAMLMNPDNWFKKPQV